MPELSVQERAEHSLRFPCNAVQVDAAYVVKVVPVVIAVVVRLLKGAQTMVGHATEAEGEKGPWLGV